MSLILTGLLVVQVLSALTIIVLVLLQQGKGADMGSAFGGGSAGSLFGAAGAANFLSRATKWAAIVFFCGTAGLAYVSHNTGKTEVPVGVMEGYQDPSVPVVPGEAAVPGASSVPQAPAANDVPAAPAAQPAAPAPKVEAPAAVPPVDKPVEEAKPVEAHKPATDAPAAADKTEEEKAPAAPAGSAN